MSMTLNLQLAELDLILQRIFLSQFENESLYKLIMGRMNTLPLVSLVMNAEKTVGVPVC